MKKKRQTSVNKVSKMSSWLAHHNDVNTLMGKDVNNDVSSFHDRLSKCEAELTRSQFEMLDELVTTSTTTQDYKADSFTNTSEDPRLARSFNEGLVFTNKANQTRKEYEMQEKGTEDPIRNEQLNIQQFINRTDSDSTDYYAAQTVEFIKNLLFD